MSSDDETSTLLPNPTTSARRSKRTPSVLRLLGLRNSSSRASEDGDEVEQHRRAWAWSSYALVLLFGVGVGVGLTLLWRANPFHRDEGPMVPPIYKLPPPTYLPRNPSYLRGPGKAAVSSEERTCSELGLTILKDHNGTAVDAAITTTLCIGTLNAFSSGIGGGGFALISLPEGEQRIVGHEVYGPENVNTSSRVIAVDFRETSPALSDRKMYKHAKAGASQVGGLAVGTPGELRGLEEMHKLYGQVPWADLVLPVARLARQFQVSRELARRLRIFGEFMLDKPAWAKVYAPDGPLAVEGDWISRPTYADTLERIAHHGAGALYDGPIADDIIRTVRATGGILTHEDLANYTARVYPAIQGKFAGQTIYTTDAPSSGAVMIGLLQILDPMRNVSKCWDVEETHNLIEAMKFAFGGRSQVTDPKFATNLTQLAQFRTREWADAQRAKIGSQTHDDPDYYGVVHESPSDHGTTHLSVVDQWGGAASVTSTVNLIWGSHVMCPETGIIMNDEQDDFSVPGVPNAFGLEPSPWNYPEPGKRPLSSTAPTITHDKHGRVRAVLGGSGGSRIFPSVAQVLINLDCGMDLAEAIELPRLHDQVSPHLTTLEVGPNRPNAVWVQGLKDRGHRIGEFDINMGASEVQGVVIDKRGVWASSDSRKNGVAAAY